ncbi:MAG: septum formation protein Maf [Alphaproteobacteria bacterium]|nr:septum formation protein Maf [Alphaproteobacteria bacterium]
MSRPLLVLASASPRRRDLLAQIAVTPDRVLAPAIDETPKKAELPRAYAIRMAGGKRAAALGAWRAEGGDAGALILAADTVVACGRRILPKAENEREVRDCLALLSGRRHQVMTAIALAAGGNMPAVRVVLARVTLKRLSDREIAAYAASGEGIGKAGGYAIQGRAGAFVKAINGSCSAIVGLPLLETAALLAAHGFPPGQ